VDVPGLELLSPSWQLSLTVAVILAATAVGLRPSRLRWARPFSAFCREFTLVMSLLALWQYVGRFVHNRADGAFERARAIVDWQEAWHLPSELSIQQAVLPFPLAVQGMNVYYAFAHLNSMGLFLVWLWWRHRDVYPRARTVVVLTTLACLLVQAIPVAPPRMLTDLGYVDTGLAYGQSVYGPMGAGIANQVAAMPSVHVAWAVIVGWYVARASSSPWRWLGPVHAVLTTLVVVATANHWWLDGIVAAGFMVLAMAGLEAVARGRGRRLRLGGAAEPSPQLPVIAVSGALNPQNRGETLREQ
jgi:drug/metabolite transporter superfamily protein YnfA